LTSDDAGAAPGALFLVATPIGNLEDASPRSVAALRDADLVLAEDTRRTRILMSRFGIDRPLRAFDAHRERDESGRVVDRIAAGEKVALVSDAGTPCVSDPGATLVRAVRAAGLRIVPIPGPSAVTAAIAAAGFEGPFVFLGFPPRKGADRRRVFERIRSSAEAVVLFESPVRAPETLRDLAEAAGPGRSAVVCRELSKIHEEIAAGPLADLASRFSGEVLGEVTIVVSAAEAETGEDEAAGHGPTLEVLADRLLAEGISPSRTARIVADLFGIGHSEAYRRVHSRL
jgi:16S rRNA (cytidine1402-2'-O)-methyltransferase